MGVQPIGIPGVWRIVFRDEFNVLDKSVWRVNFNGADQTAITHPVQRDNELQCYDPAQVDIFEGNLRIRIVDKPCTIDGKTYKYRSGIINTNHWRAFTYGAFEARMCLAAASPGVIANWPAWFMQGVTPPPWPDHGELDIVEGLTSSFGPGRAAFHFHSPLTNAGGWPEGDWTGWHTFGSKWAPDHASFYYDGNLVGTLTFGITNLPMYPCVYLATSALRGGPIVVPSELLVDYVRIWKLKH